MYVNTLLFAISDPDNKKFCWYFSDILVLCGALEIDLTVQD